MKTLKDREIQSEYIERTSVVDPNTVNWIWIRIQDFGPIWIRIQGYTVNFHWFWKKKYNFWCWEKHFSLKQYIFSKNIITKCHLKKFLHSWVSELLIYILNLTSLAFILSYNYMCGSWSGIRNQIQKAPGYGSSTDPDPQH